MRIVDLQRRLYEIGRIRMGEKVVTKSGKAAPSKIDRFRFTSKNKRAIEGAAEVWGGEVIPWDDAPDGRQWQVYLATTEIPAVVPPGDMSFSQSYEQWTKGGCKVRCDGRWDVQGDRACHCDPTARDCDIHTRLSVILPDVPGLGLWRLDTQSYYAAVELGGAADICAAQSARGVMLPAHLRLEQRSVKRMVEGRPQTFKFAVPVLDLDVHPLSLSAGATPTPLGGPAPVTGELEGPKLTPVPPVDGSLAPTVAEQVAAIDTPSRAERSNAAQPIPATGLKPRTAAEADPYVSAWNAERMQKTIVEAGADVAQVVLAGTGGRTDDPAQVYKAEMDAVRQALAAAVEPAEVSDSPSAADQPELAEPSDTGGQPAYAPDDPARPFEPDPERHIYQPGDEEF